MLPNLGSQYFSKLTGKHEFTCMSLFSSITLKHLAVSIKTPSSYTIITHNTFNKLLWDNLFKTAVFKAWFLSYNCNLSWNKIFHVQQLAKVFTVDIMPLCYLVRSSFRRKKFACNFFAANLKTLHFTITRKRLHKKWKSFLET